MSNATLTIEKAESGEFSVCLGDHYDRMLTADEALACVAYAIMHAWEPYRYLRTKEEWDQWKAKVGKEVYD